MYSVAFVKLCIIRSGPQAGHKRHRAWSTSDIEIPRSPPTHTNHVAESVARTHATRVPTPGTPDARRSPCNGLQPPQGTCTLTVASGEQLSCSGPTQRPGSASLHRATPNTTRTTQRRPRATGRGPTSANAGPRHDTRRAKCPATYPKCEPGGAKTPHEECRC